MIDGGDFSSSLEAEYFAGFNTISKNNKSKNKRRFTDQQVKSLENIFESESKLEPRKKMQLAGELGLQPRQVAIWFQNKRARWKSKQIEQDYSILRANYDTLASQFENLKKEKQSLLTQLHKLNDLMEKSKKASESCGETVARDSSTGGNSDHGEHIKCEFGVKPCLSPEISERRFAVQSDDDSGIRAKYLGLDGEAELMSIVEPADSSLTSPENWGSLDSDRLLHQPTSCDDQWLDFWS